MFPTSSRNTPWLRPVRLACLAAVVAASSAPAWAVTTLPLSFTGKLANAGTSQSLSPTTQQDFWGMPLDPGTIPFSIKVGDTIEATVTLDGTYNLPAASTLPGSYRVVRLFFFGTDLMPLNPVGTQGEVELFEGGTSVLHLTNQGCGTSTALAACASWGAPDIGPLTFDSVKFTFQIDQLGGLTTPVTVTSAAFDTVISTPVPEVSTWALLGVGLAVVGSAARRRREAPAV